MTGRLQSFDHPARQHQVADGDEDPGQGQDLLGASFAELFANAFRPAPHLDDLDPALADLTEVEGAGVSLAVHPGEHSLDGLRCRGLAEAVGHHQAPVPIRPGIGLGIDEAELDGGVDVPGLVVDAKVNLEIGPVIGERIEYRLEVLSALLGIEQGASA